MKKVVVVGGGTGTYVLTQMLKSYEDFELTKMVTVFDDGGSSGRLRDEFGFLPVGDLRQSLASLASDNGDAWIQKLLLYRFSKGEGLVGHNLGNLILTALQDMTGSTPKALEVAAKAFRLKGKIFPVTTGDSRLVTSYVDGTQIVGEHSLDEVANGGKMIKKITLDKPCKIYSKAKEALLDADFVIFGPGDLYGSILPNLIVEGARKALKDSPAKLIYITNLMTRFTQTHEYTAAKHLSEIEKYAGRKMDVVLINSGPITDDILKLYAKHHEFPVIDDVQARPGLKIVRQDLVNKAMVKKVAGDNLVRSLVRHDRDKLASALLPVLAE